MMEGGDFSMWQQQGSETGMSLVPLKIVLALPLPAFLVEKSLKLEYTALATVTVRYNLWK